MFETREELAELADRLYRLAAPMKRGDLIENAAIVGVLGVEPHVHPWPLVVGKFRRRMLKERHIACWPVYGVGLKICTTQEQLDLAHVRQVRARRQIRRGIRTTEALPKSQLNTKQRELMQLQLGNLRRAHKDLTSQICVKLPTGRASDTLPRARPEVPAKAG